MGQKTHPKGFRVGIIEPWESTWHAKRKDYPEFVKEDDKLRKYIKSSACHVKVCLTVNISENPILYFSHEFIEFINYLNAEFEIDSYLEYDNKNNGVICDSQS